MRLALVPLALALAVGCADDGGLVCDRPGVNVETIGGPTWRLTTPVVFSAPYGEGDEIVETATSVFPAPLWGFEPAIGPVAGERSTLDFDRYVQERVAALGYPTGPRFTTAQFEGGPAIYVVALLVPDDSAPYGSASDYGDGSGPIIPHDTYGFEFSGRVLRDCEVFDPNLNFRWENPPSSHEMYDGQTRIVLMQWSAYEFRFDDTVPAPGTYLHEQTIVDSINRGYRFTVQFVVE